MGLGDSVLILLLLPLLSRGRLFSGDRSTIAGASDCRLADVGAEENYVRRVVIGVRINFHTF